MKSVADRRRVGSLEGLATKPRLSGRGGYGLPVGLSSFRNFWRLVFPLAGQLCARPGAATFRGLSGPGSSDSSERRSGRAKIFDNLVGRKYIRRLVCFEFIRATNSKS